MNRAEIFAAIEREPGWKQDYGFPKSESLRGSYDDALGFVRPWPFREASDPIPVFCPRDGRPLVLTHWGMGDSRYWELSCFGRPPFRWLRQLLVPLRLPDQGHWNFTVCHSTRLIAGGRFNVFSGKRK